MHFIVFATQLVAEANRNLPLGKVTEVSSDVSQPVRHPRLVRGFSSVRCGAADQIEYTRCNTLRGGGREESSLKILRFLRAREELLQLITRSRFLLPEQSKDPWYDWESPISSLCDQEPDCDRRPTSR